MEPQPLLGRYRNAIGQRWLVMLFAGIYIVSQAIIIVLLEQVGSDQAAKLQLFGFTADYYLETFNSWESAGTMAFYKAHLFIDAVHPIWYTLTLSALLALSMNGKELDHKHNRLLVLPMLVGLCDTLENSIQLVFLSDPSYVTVVDPLPLISTLLSLTKWTLASVVIGLIVKGFMSATTKSELSPDY